MQRYLQAMRVLAFAIVGSFGLAVTESNSFATTSQTYPVSMCQPTFYSGLDFDDQSQDRPNYIRLDQGMQGINHNNYDAWYYLTCPIVRQDDANASGSVFAEMSYHSPNNGDSFFCAFDSFDQYGNELGEIIGSYTGSDTWETMSFTTTNFSAYGYFNMFCLLATGVPKFYSYRFSEQ